VRGGFVGDAAVSPQESTSALPIALAIEAAGIDAQIEVQQIVDGVMQNPSGPWVVSWYKQTALLGEGGNVVMAGHVDYWNVGPAVFFDLRNLVEGDEVQVFGDGDVAYTYAVETNETYDLEELTSGTITELVGQTEDPKLTLITCGGEFDYASGEYLSRMVVRAGLVE
jgi:sortase (surface protein transpeptidase)